MQIPQYQSLKEKEDVFGDRYLCIAEENQLIDWHTKYDIDVREQSPYLFRGINEAKYKNYTSAQRYWMAKNLVNVTPQQLIEQQIKSLKRTNNHLLTNYCFLSGLYASDLYLLSFSQHYGGISPFLDFTKSLDTALFFARHKANENKNTNYIDDYVSLYFVKSLHNPKFYTVDILSNDLMSQYPFNLPISESNRIKQEKLQKDFYNKLTYDNLRKTWSGKTHLIVNNCINGRLINGEIFHLKSVIENLHLLAQSALFIYSDNADQPFEEDLYCVDIHKSLLPLIDQQILKRRKINLKYLFPNPQQIVKNATRLTHRYATNPTLCTDETMDILDELRIQRHIPR